MLGDLQVATTKVLPSASDALTNPAPIPLEQPVIRGTHSGRDKSLPFVLSKNNNTTRKIFNKRNSFVSKQKFATYTFKEHQGENRNSPVIKTVFAFAAIVKKELRKRVRRNIS